MDEPRRIYPDSLPFAPEDRRRLSLTAEQVYHAYGPRIYSMARRMVSNEKDAEDVTQDVFLQVVRKLPSFRGESAFPTWLHRVTVNAALAYRRKRAVRERGRSRGCKGRARELPRAAGRTKHCMTSREAVGGV